MEILITVWLFVPGYLALIGLSVPIALSLMDGKLMSITDEEAFKGISIFVTSFFWPLILVAAILGIPGYALLKAGRHTKGLIQETWKGPPASTGALSLLPDKEQK